MSQHPPFKPDEVIQRLREENSQLLSLIDEIKLIITSDKEFDGCTTVGGLKAMLKTIRTQREKIFELERKVQSLKNRR